jgi:hypothetical protein
MALRQRGWAIFFGLLATWVGGWLVVAVDRTAPELT